MYLLGVVLAYGRANANNHFVSNKYQTEREGMTVNEWFAIVIGNWITFFFLLTLYFQDKSKFLRFS